MGNIVAGITSVGLALVVVLLLFTPLMSSVTSDRVSNVTVAEGSATEVTNHLDASALSVNETNATLEMENSQTLSSESKLLNTSSTESFNVSGEVVNATLVEVEDNTTTTLSITSPRTFGKGPFETTFYQNIDVLLAIFALVLLFGGLAVMV